MHEMSIAQGIVSIVRRRLSAEECTRVKSVRIRVGEIAGVEPASLQFCFDVIKQDESLTSADLRIERTPLVVECEAGHRSACPNPWDMSCVICGNGRTKIISGSELEVVDVEIGERMECV